LSLVFKAVFLYILSVYDKGLNRIYRWIH